MNNFKKSIYKHSNIGGICPQPDLGINNIFIESTTNIVRFIFTENTDYDYTNVISSNLQYRVGLGSFNNIPNITRTSTGHWQGTIDNIPNGSSVSFRTYFPVSSCPGQEYSNVVGKTWTGSDTSNQ